MSSHEHIEDLDYDQDGELELIGASSGMSELDPALEARLLASVASTRRFDAFAGDVAELLAIGLNDACAALVRHMNTWAPKASSSCRVVVMIQGGSFGPVSGCIPPLAAFMGSWFAPGPICCTWPSWKRA